MLLSVTIRKAAITITADDKIGPDPGTTAVELTWRISDALAAADEAGLAVSASLGAKRNTIPVTYPIVISYTPDSNYDITVQNGTYTVQDELTFSFSGYNGEYDGYTHSFVMDSNNKYIGLIYDKKELSIPKNLGIDDLEAYFATAGAKEVSFTDVGTYTVYYYVLTEAGTVIPGITSIIITPKTLTITADEKEKTYGEKDPALTFSFDGLLEEDKDTVTGELSRAAGESVGTYAIQQGTVTASGNYTLVYVPALLTINPGSVAKTEITGLKDMTYTGKPLTQKIKVTSGNSVLTEGKDYTVEYKNNTNAGTATVTITGINDYTDSAEAHFKIAKAGNTLKVSSKSKTYKRVKLTKKKSFTIKAAGAQGKVKYSLSKAAKAAGIKVTAKGKVTVPKNCKAGTYKINVKALGNGNYKDKTVKVTVKVVKAANTLKAAVKQKTYQQKKLTKAESFKIGVTKAKGKVKYTLTKKAKTAGIKVTSKGKVTVPAKCRKGTYKIKVRAKGNGSYKAKNIYVKVIVK